MALTVLFSTMWCAYFFFFLCVLAGPAAYHAFATGDFMTGVAWATGLFQAVSIPIIIVGQAQQNIAADRRAAKEFDDIEAMRSDTALAVDRLDETTEGGLKTVIDLLKEIRDNEARA